MNTFIDNLETISNYHLTENGGLTHRTTRSAVYDLFALGGAYRVRSDADCILLFKKALEEDETLALKCLFYLRDCRGGQGERRFFRVCFKWLANEHPEAAARNLLNLSEYGRWDDLIYTCIDTLLEDDALAIIKEQLALDVQCKTPSLLAKWLPSENASSSETKRMGNIVRNYMGWTHKEYRKVLSTLRERINIVERLMSANRWDEIEFDKIPSRAGLIYKNAFARRDIIAKKYETFAKDKNTTVNANVLYPYEVVAKALAGCPLWEVFHKSDASDTDRAIIEKYWNNLPDYLNGADCKMMCVVDTSASMTWFGGNAAPINIAIGLGMYCAERISGPFKDYYISFSRFPQLIHVEGVDFVDKVQRIYKTNLCENTDLVKTFEMLRKIALQSDPDDIPTNIVVISDMEIDRGTIYSHQNQLLTEMETERKRWERDGLVFPHLTYWNVQARHDNVLDLDENVSYVSGFSPVLFESILSGKTGWDLCLEKLLSKRYEAVK